jgi:hypothetical protein
MTPDLLERLRIFVDGHRHKSRVSALNCKENGYRQLAAEHENEAVFAEQLLLELAKE